MGTERHGAKDAFWMVADDLIEGGYIPVSFEDHIQIQEENAEKIFNIVGALVALANQNGMAIVGGETAIINTLQGIEVGISGEGYVKKGHQIIKSARPGDVIIGIESDNLHSNGYTFVRDTLLKQYGLDSKAPWCNRTVGEELTVPTRGYLPVIKELLRQFTCDSGQAATEYASQHIHGMVHITGGGLSKLGELCPYKNVDISINRKHKLEPQEIFRFIQREFAIASEKMYTRFNNGIGYVMAVSDNAAEAALGIIRNYYPAEVIGNVTGGTGKITIESKYDSETVSF
jgi:phosphoribosylformylglycinamidine cyclo-ligase